MTKKEILKRLDTGEVLVSQYLISTRDDILFFYKVNKQYFGYHVLSYHEDTCRLYNINDELHWRLYTSPEKFNLYFISKEEFNLRYRL